MAEEGLLAKEQGGFRKMRPSIITSAIEPDGDVEEMEWIDCGIYRLLQGL